MGRSLSWIEAHDVERALAQIPRPSSPEASVLPSPPPEAPARLPAPFSLRPPPSRAPRSDPATSGRSSRPGDRIQAFAEWLEASHPPQRWFLADEEGFVLYERGWGPEGVARALPTLRRYRSPELLEVSLVWAGSPVRTLWLEASFGPVVLVIEADDSTDVRSELSRALGSRSDI